MLLAIGIGLVLALFVGFGIAAFYEEPEEEDYCDDTYYERPYPKPVVEAIGSGNCTYIEPSDELKKECKDKGDISAEYDENGCVESYYCL